ncbi:unnamed protein product [Phaeothamnion confervicola]
MDTSPQPRYDVLRHDEFGRSVAPVLAAAVAQRLVGSDETPAAEFIDLDGLEAQLRRCSEAFSSTEACSVLNAYAIKANPLAAVLQIVREAGQRLHLCSNLRFPPPSSLFCELAVKQHLTHILRASFSHILISPGFGAECASPEEVAHTLALGFPPELIVYDSPCKTVSDLRRVLTNGCHVNLDSEAEVVKVERLIAEDRAVAAAVAAAGDSSNGGTGSRAAVGLRINPAVGPGAIAETSTATRESKFGAALGPATEERLLCLFERCPWLSGVHCHVGSQGCAPALLVAGAVAAVRFAEAVNSHVGRRQVTWIDVGGGLSLDYAAPAAAAGACSGGVDFAGYAAALRAAAPALFTGGYRVLTEFGRSIVTAAGFTASVVESCKDCGGTATAVVHVGANLFVREAYCPGRWFHRLTVHCPDGNVKCTGAMGAAAAAATTGAKDEATASCSNGDCSKQCSCGGGGEGCDGCNSTCSENDYGGGVGLVPQTVAGPLCFSGDVLARRLPLPRIEERDWVVIHDTGGYTSAMYSMYNSRTPPLVLGYRRTRRRQQQWLDSGEPDGDEEAEAEAEPLGFAFQVLKQQTAEQTLAFWS